MIGGEVGPIPTAPLYVCATYTGRHGRIKRRAVVPVPDWAAAGALAADLETRDDLERVQVCRIKPRCRAGVLYELRADWAPT